MVRYPVWSLFVKGLGKCSKFPGAHRIEKKAVFYIVFFAEGGGGGGEGGGGYLSWKATADILHKIFKTQMAATSSISRGNIIYDF